MKMCIVIGVNNAAFGDNPHHEVARILHKLSADVAHDGLPGKDDVIGVLDLNGNRIGDMVLLADGEHRNVTG